MYEEAPAAAASKVRQAGVLSVKGLVVAPTGKSAAAGGLAEDADEQAAWRDAPCGGSSKQGWRADKYTYSHTLFPAQCVSSGTGMR
jgi:hypothetical protein